MNLESLQSTIAELQEKLSFFSFDELSTEEASVLQDSLNKFKDLVAMSTSKQFLFIGDVAKPDYNKELKEVSPKGLSKQGFINNLESDNQLLVAKANNEIKTPLNGILGFADQLLESSLNAEQWSLVNAIQTTAYNMLEVSQDILEYSKIGAGLDKNENISIKFYSAIRDVLFLCNTLILNKDLKIEVDIDSNIPKELLGDPSKLSQVLLNLLGNAIQNTKKGEILLTAKVKEKQQHNLLLEFQVCDTSEGIADESLKNVFNLFNEKDGKNSGLGLSVAKQMVEALGGEISVSSRAGVGTVFTFTMPFATTVDIEVIPEVISAEGMNILIFEDKELNQKIIDVNLKKWNYKTFVANAFEKGIKILEHNEIDVILIDLRMATINGFEIANSIRNHSSGLFQKTPIIAVSADHDFSNNNEFDDNDFNDFLLKPYNSDELLEKLLRQEEVKLKNKDAMVSNHINDNRECTKVELTQVLNECMGDIDLLKELVALFKNNVLEFIGKAMIQIKNEDYEALKFSIHKIKAGLKMLKTENLLNNLLQIEKEIEGDVDVKHLNFLYNCFLEEYPIIEAQVDSEINRIMTKR